VSLKIVVVDDDNVTARVLEKVLSDKGMEVQIAQDGMKGLDLIQTTSPDVAIIDLLIPKVHGLELCQRIRENDLLQNVSIVLMSAVYQYSTFRNEIESSGADFFINKPIDTPKLLDFLDGIKRPETT
jgi:DNA-binding response OmpR family regulator